MYKEMGRAKGTPPAGSEANVSNSDIAEPKSTVRQVIKPSFTDTQNGLYPENEQQMGMAHVETGGPSWFLFFKLDLA